MGFLLRLLLGKCFVGMAFCPKEASKGRGHLMHAIGIGIERGSNPYLGGKAYIEREEKQNKEFYLEMESGTTSTL